MLNKDLVSGDYQLLLGDCLERMKEIPDGSIDMVLWHVTINIEL